MALQALGMEKRLVRDVIELERTALQPTNKGTTPSTSKSTSIVRTNRRSERANAQPRGSLGRVTENTLF
jgi:hypothetical protein